MSVLERIPELACTRCKGPLEERDRQLDCRACGQVYEVHSGIPNMLTGDLRAFAEEISVQDRVAGEYVSKRYRDPNARAYHESWTDRMIAEVRPHGRVLDNGCGVGSLFGKIPNEGVVGIDISSEMLHVAAVRSDQLVLGNSQDLPFGDRTFDIAFCRSLLHHLLRPEMALREMFRVLRPGGRLALIDTNTSILSALPRWVANRGDHFSSHHANLTRRRLEALLTPYFHIERVSYFGYLAYPLLGFPDLCSAFRYFPLKRFSARALTAFDDVLSRTPILRTQSWGIRMTALRREHAAP